MARLWMTGFEWQSAAAGVEVASVAGSPAIDTTTKNGGAASLKVSGSIAASAVQSVTSPTFTASSKVYGKYDLYIDAMPNDPAAVAYCEMSSGATNVFSIQFWNDNGTLTGVAYYNNFGGSSSNFTTGLAFDQWFRLEVLYDTTPADGSEVLEVRINGTTVVNLTNLTYTTKTVNTSVSGVFNGTAGAITTEVAYFDNIVINSSGGSFNNTWVGDERIAIAVPTGAGDNAATTGVYSYINEIPPSDTATTGSTMIELDNNPTNADYNMTDTSTMGIGSGDAIKCIAPMARVREEAAGTSNYTLRIKSAAGGTTTSSSSVDAGNATARTNPSSTTAFGIKFFSESDPTTGVAWTPTGTNSVDNMQVGAGTTDGTPDTWILTLCAMVGYVPAVAHSSTPSDTATASDAASNKPGLNKSDSVTASDAATTAPVKKPADTATPSDSFSAVVTFIRSLSDSATASDAASNKPALNKADSVTASDNITPLLIQLLVLSDSVTASDAAVKNSGKAASDTATASDSPSKKPALSKSDTATPSDQASKIITIAKTDVSTPSDATSKKPVIIRTDSVTVTDVIAKAAALSRSDSATVTDALVKAFTGAKSDTVTTSEIIAKTIVKFASDIATASDEITTEYTPDGGETLTQSLDDSLTISDAATKAIIKNIADSINVSDAETKLWGTTVALSDILAATDSIRLIVNGATRWYVRADGTFAEKNETSFAQSNKTTFAQQNQTEWYNKNS